MTLCHGFTSDRHNDCQVITAVTFVLMCENLVESMHLVVSLAGETSCMLDENEKLQVCDHVVLFFMSD